MSLILHIWLAVLDILRPKHRRKAFYWTLIQQSADESPHNPKAYELRLIRGGEYDKWLKFECPNRCGANITLNLNRGRSPFWAVTVHKDKTLSISPSVIHDTCGAHFFIRHSKIDWV